MKFLILNTDYPEFLRRLYAQHPGLEKRPYDEQMRVRNESLFGVADFYSRNLLKLGHEAYDIHANNEFMQKAWAREHGREVREPARSVGTRYLRSFLRPLLRSRDSEPAWFRNVLTAQIRHHKPDVILNQAVSQISGRFLKSIDPCVRLLMGQIASPLPEGEDFASYDLLVSSLPNLVQFFRRIGRSAELHRLAFEPLVLSMLRNHVKRVSISFVGSLFSSHRSRIEWLELLSRCLDVQIWGQGVSGLPENSWIRKRYEGNAWGIQMYGILHSSKITLNNHIDVAGSYANNMRLFEATGVGALLVTDWKVNLHEMFEPGKEVVAYRSPEECVELVQYYLEHDKEREAIARAGQERTLREHTYYHRMQELVEIVGRYL